MRSGELRRGGSRAASTLSLGASSVLLLPALLLVAIAQGGVDTGLAAPAPDRAAAHAPLPTPHSPRALRVCADPNNLPFSNAKGEGFENRLAEIVAREMGTTVSYDWWPQRRGWVRHTIGAGKCDIAMGVPADFDPLLTTRPYYRSTYVFISRADRKYGFHSLDDPRLRTLRVGLHFIGTDYSNPPPAHALGARGIVDNIVRFSIYGDYRRPNPPADLIAAVAHDSVDVAIVWGPLGGYFATREGVPLSVTPVSPLVDPSSGERFAFPIAVGVRKGDAALRDAVQRALDRRAGAVRALLTSYGVPQL